MIIRPETPADYAAIADVNLRAFDEHRGEPLLVALSRQRRAFDPELSLVAEIDGKVAGHVLFIPYTVRLLGADVPAVNLAPLAVDPAYQRQGIGKALLEEGHRVARHKGYAFSLLLGHTSYYPRLGYRASAYGDSVVEVMASSLPDVPALQSRAPLLADVPALLDLWRHEEGGVDFALTPEASLFEWYSPDPAIRSLVYLRDEQIVGYARFRQTGSAQPLAFLARDADAARAVAASLVGDSTVLMLPLHPYSASASAFGVPTVRVWDAAMTFALQPGALDDYFAALNAGTRAAGRPQWPTVFDFT